MDIKSEGKTLLDNHKKLYEQLIEIPEKREMIYIEEMEEGVKVGKPRFKNPKYQWFTSLLVDVRDHLQNFIVVSVIYIFIYLIFKLSNLQFSIKMYKNSEYNES